MVWYPISEFSICYNPQSKALGILNETEVDVYPILSMIQ